ncbi:MAG: hypothetical protein M3126_11700 [Candidatus Eremiobacteraeota bacterium]|nr:hypothetical protein [Candidatus Eremiobacteraeota bacterium]
MRIYHTSDLHDHRGIVAPLQALRKAQPGLLFDCGDSLRGSQTVYHKEEPVIAEIDAAGYDAQAIGNREFHYFFGLLKARAAQMHHPLVCSNLIDTKRRALPFNDHLRLQTPYGPVYLAGLLIMQYREGSFWERVFGWRFLDPVATIRAHAQRVRPDELFIVLSHIGLSLDRKLAAAVPRIDLLLGGHSHDTLSAPEFAGKVPIVHAGPYGKFVSATQMRFDPARARYVVDGFELLPLLK